MLRQIWCQWLGLGLILLGLTVPARAEDESLSGLLSLVSLEYQLDGKLVPRPKPFAAYIPYLKSNDLAILDVAAMSAVCDFVAIQHVMATRRRGQALNELVPFGGFGTSPAAEDHYAELDAQLAQFEERISGLIINALDQGALKAFAGENILPNGADGPKGGVKNFANNSIQAQSDQYRLEVSKKRMQAKLWEASAALARTTASLGNFREPGVRVLIQMQPRRGSWLVIENKSSVALHQVTLTALAKHPQVNGRDSRHANQALGAAGQLAAGADDPAKIGKNAQAFASSVDDFNTARNLPTRVFLHIPEIAAGQEARAMFFMPGFDEPGIDLPTFSLWSREGSIDDQVVGGLNEFRAAIKHNQAEAGVVAKNKAAQPKPGGILSGNPPARTSPATPPTRAGTPAPNTRKAAPPKVEAPQAPMTSTSFQTLSTSTYLVLKPDKEGTNTFSLTTCRNSGKAYIGTGRTIRTLCSEALPLKAIAENSEGYVAVGIDSDTRATALVIVPKSMVKDVKTHK